MEKLKQEDIDKAFYMAEKARNNSYSPYSKFKVGACIKTKTNDFFIGTNVENASFGATCCAERSAILNMIAKIGVQEIDFLLLNTSPECIPCAICLQVMAEFFNQDTKIIITESKSFSENKTPIKIYTLKDLLKSPFDKKELLRVTYSELEKKLI
ncbi:cytidine deaminase [Borreliella burgdorferi]|uniref:Cytidine deaminase n=1 Tax=Borreliella burgdorferi 118a TaxID=476210 RepID=A0A7U8EZK5_BORBG|nr:cytidine deaminase [Borreliella burgdorferi]EOA79984.1 cytidine deaminase [Borreliella burgdorferi CA8]ADQ29491.1 cytidine deaminase [Borreliella burgdorferi N40]ATH10156.1 cytidine deaminase [Borreliella burgdorferi]AXK70600.1 Cytidine deaminase [Borreliella burgdorferi]EEC22023.1 cytidine deaminase [Borreliella burgdorferi 156a]